MRLSVAIEGRLDRLMAEELRIAELGLTRAVRTSSRGLQTALRRQVRSAGFPTNLEKAIQRSHYPRQGTSLHPAGLVFSKATRIHEAWQRDRTPRPSGTGVEWLVIPLPEAERRGFATVTVAFGRERRGGNLGAALAARLKLRPRWLGPNRALLVTDDGTPLFALRKQVHQRKKLDFDRATEQAANRLPQLIVREMDRAAR